jgi:hypothetical protein
MVSHRCICTACGKRRVVQVMSQGHTFRIVYDSSRKDSNYGFEQCTRCGANRELEVSQGPETVASSGGGLSDFMRLNSAHTPGIENQWLQTTDSGSKSRSLIRVEATFITLQLKTLTPDGKQIVDSLLDRRQELPCDCRQNESCIVEITEMPDQRIDVIVRRPRPVADCRDWKPYAVVEGMYGRRFDRGTTANCICESLSEILGPADI